MTEVLHGWIDEVEDGIVWGRTVRSNGDELEFWIPLLLVMESQRVDLQPGAYCSIVNGELLIESAVWTTHDIETAKERGARLYRDLGWVSPTYALSSNQRTPQRE